MAGPVSSSSAPLRSEPAAAAASSSAAAPPGPVPTVAPPVGPSSKARVVDVAALGQEEREALGQEVLEKLRAQFPAEVLEITPRPGVLARVRFAPGAVVRLGTWLRDQGSFDHCAMVAGIDWRETREVLYHLWSDALRTYLELATFVPGDDPHLESVQGIWFGANWHEREAWDLVGIRFDHHPDLRRLLLHEGYKFHPLLKTFELHEPEELEVKSRRGR